MSIFDTQVPQQSMGFQFWKLHTAWQKNVSTALAPFNITHTQFIILAAIAWFEEQGTKPSQAQVSKLMNLDKMTFSKAIRQLETKKLVKRTKNKKDARMLKLSLKKQALKVVPQAMQAIESVDKDIFSALGDHQQTFNKILLILNKNLAA